MRETDVEMVRFSFRTMTMFKIRKYVCTLNNDGKGFI